MPTDAMNNEFVSYLPDNYHEIFAVALLGYGEILKTKLDSEEERRAATTRAERRRNLMTEDGGLGVPVEVLRNPEAIRAYLQSEIDSEDVTRWLLVDCFFADPFVPNEGETTINIGGDLKLGALLELAQWCGLGEGHKRLARFEEVMKSAVNSHKAFYERGPFWVGLAVIFAVLSGGLFWLAAPAIGAIIGGTMGLYGAAATAAGLAALGGGSLAIGGAGMAGGTALIAGLGALAGGAVGAIGGPVLFGALTAEGVRFEMIKLQTTYGYILARSDAGSANEAAAIEVRAALDKLIAEESEILDQSVADFEAHTDKEADETILQEIDQRSKKLKSMDRARQWMAEFRP